MEFKGNLHFHCPKSGFAADIEFQTKSMFSNKTNKISGIITKEEHGKVQPIYKIKGQWHELVEVSDMKGKVLFSWNRTKLFPARVEINQSNPKSSTKVWKAVADAIQTKR